jgi:hypothetical protein
LYKGAREKLRCTTGWFFSYLIFGILTAVFYYMVAEIAGTGNTDAVLIGNVSAISTSSITAKVVLMLIFDFVYAFLIFRYIKNVVFKGGLAGLKSYIQDGGFSHFQEIATNISDRISGGFKGVSESIGNMPLFNAKAQKTEITNKEENSVHTTIDKGKVGNHEVNEKNKKNGVDNDINDAGIVTEEIREKSKRTTERNRSQINKQIEIGKAEEQKAEEQKQAESQKK